MTTSLGSKVKAGKNKSYKCIPSFNTSGSFTPSVGVNATHGDKVDYLVVAGGGGGGWMLAGGGGAGGYRTAPSFSVSSGSPITVTVGAGGAGNNGTSNSFNGSTGYTGSPPIPELLSQHLSNNGIENVVYNFSVNSSNHNQHIHRLTKYINFHYDVVIFYGGNNESLQYLQYDTRP